ncbi:MAG: superinfection immunity protein [Pseudomonadota bacterium]
MPAIIAVRRGHPQRLAIGVLNGLGGWTGLGWVAALVWSLTNIGSEDRVIRVGEIRHG